LVVYTGLNGAINIQFIQYNNIIFHKQKQNTTFSLFHKIFYGPLKLKNILTVSGINTKQTMGISLFKKKWKIAYVLKE